MMGNYFQRECTHLFLQIFVCTITGAVTYLSEEQKSLKWGREYD